VLKAPDQISKLAMNLKRCFLALLSGAVFSTAVASVVAQGDKSPSPPRSKHWAYQPIQRPPVPAVQDTAWARNDIDRFVLAKIESQRIRPAADAPPAVLLRRAYFDLIGLPPTAQQIEAYLNDRSPDRYERMIDQLLASPRFGERWGRHWLDVARFGESLTLRGFVLKDAWRYRDYVIDTFNQDRPFDRFMQEQVAGDLMPSASLPQRRQQLIGTAFLMLGNNNLEEQDKKQLEMDVVDEQIGTISTAFLAQTIGCARCHDHKFDPISTRDYYALAGILHSTQSLTHSNVSKWLDIPLPMEPARDEAVKKFDAQVAALQMKVDLAKASLPKAPGDGAVLAVAMLPGIVVDDVKATQVGMWKSSKSVHSYVGEGYLTDNGDRSETKTLTFQPEIPETAKYDVRFAYTAATNRASNVQVTVFSGDGEKTVTVNEREAPPIDGHFVSLGHYTFDSGNQGYVLVTNQGADGHVIADAVQFYPADMLTSASAASSSLAPSTQAARVHATPQEVKKLEAELKKLTASGPTRDTIISVREAREIGDSPVNIRGSIHSLGDMVHRGFPQVIAVSNAPKIPETESGRLELAQWLADPQNPLPARVMANRVWHWLFGSGIVRTTDNFGTTGELPSNPALLDYLASQFVQDGWSVKSLIRQIVLSHAYQLSTTSDPKALAFDPENRLCWHANRRRLEAECIRDAMLSASGQLTLDGGGQTYKPDLKSDFGFKQSGTCRSVYLPIFRNAMPEIFDAFDFADPSVSNGRRNVSTVAPQSLFMLNNPFVIEQSGDAADQLLADKNCPDDRTRLTQAYLMTLGRPPTDRERKIAGEFLRGSSDPRDGWSQVMHALFASMDFRYED
jgi:hypothetical protein